MTFLFDMQGKIGQLRKDPEVEAKRLASLPKREDHWNWNPSPNKLTLHKRLHRKFGKASQFSCIDCPKKAHDWSNETGNYTDKIEDYRPRCRSCHVKKDKNWLGSNHV